ncbi:hypothetical protein EDD37DRAFT_689791 [Exophiala viscosa]|uniref:uncharacterized protein n=1 Tax=Exophiala viscosa TaxID=2486360 RepID=UPI00219DC6C3|nr:hypothetical protein EDD37DRAFT_689791 [Exophiala viscosa]
MAHGMFATFKVSKKETGTTRPMVRHRRSTKGCYTCRRLRKKCDETRPICRRCGQKSSVQCIWEAEQQLSPCNSGATHTTSTASPCSLYTSTTSTTPWSPQLTLQSYIAHQYTAETQAFDIDFRQLEYLLRTFDNIHCVSWVDPKHSLVALGFQYALERPSLMYAFAACGAAILAKIDSRWEKVSLAHHTRSIRSVSTALNSIRTPTADDHEWLLASINALHIFETLRNYDSRPNTFHLTAAVRLCAREAEPPPPMTLFKHRILGEFIFQLAIASTFHASCFPSEQPLLYVHDLLETLCVDCDLVDSETLNWATSSPVGIIHEVFDWIFRLSYLRLQVPLTGWHRTEAKAILVKLESWRPLSPYSATTMHPAGLPFEMTVIADLYRCASLILAHKILQPTLIPKDAVIRSYVNHGVVLLNNISDLKLKDTTLVIWPIFILGLGAGTDEEKVACQRPLQYLLSTCGIGCTQGILKLLLHAWGCQPTVDGAGSGLDVIFRDDLLCQVIF